MTDWNSLPLPELFEHLTADGAVDDLIEIALEEDLGMSVDVTTESVIDPDIEGRAEVVLRQDGVVCGLPAAYRVTTLVDDLAMETTVNDGNAGRAGQSLATLVGPLSGILIVERILLNFLCHLSGVATLTRKFVEAVAGTKAVICDTRKTTPGMRALEKYAVRCGGGTMHRLGLFDAALFKDNHLAAIGPDELNTKLADAIHRIRDEHDVQFIEVEVDSLTQLKTILSMESDLVDMVLLDNFDVNDLDEAVAIRDQRSPKIVLESSGGVTLQTVRAIAETGVDRIAVGAITHSAPALDIGLDIQ